MASRCLKSFSFIRVSQAFWTDSRLVVSRNVARESLDSLVLTQTSCAILALEPRIAKPTARGTDCQKATRWWAACLHGVLCSWLTVSH